MQGIIWVFSKNLAFTICKWPEKWYWHWDTALAGPQPRSQSNWERKGLREEAVGGHAATVWRFGTDCYWDLGLSSSGLHWQLIHIDTQKSRGLLEEQGISHPRLIFGSFLLKFFKFSSKVSSSVFLNALRHLIVQCNYSCEFSQNFETTIWGFQNITVHFRFYWAFVSSLADISAKTDITLNCSKTLNNFSLKCLD